MLPDSVCVACYITVVLTLSLLLALATSPELPQLPALGRMLKFGTPTLIRTERTLPFERSDFANLSMGAKKKQGDAFCMVTIFY